jgi:nucleotide-binding universal stress UspA family protein/predicted phosphoribosyltransferase
MEAVKSTHEKTPLFSDRKEAGGLLASRLGHLAGSHPFILGIPGGGVLVAAPIARALGGELGLAEILPHPALSRRAAATARMRTAAGAQNAMLGVRSYGDLQTQDLQDWGSKLPDVLGRVVVLVDDGLHSEAGVHDMLKAIRAHGARKTILALPFARESTLARFEAECETIVTLHMMSQSISPRTLYRNPDSPTLEQVQALLPTKTVEPVQEDAAIFPRALVAVDFSPCSARAARYAARLVGDEGEMALLHVIPVPVETDDYKAMGETIDNLREFEHIQVPGSTDCVRVVTSGDVASSILRAANAGNHTVIVMGTHGRTGIQRLLLGSVAEQVVRKSNVPVLVVPA